MTVHHLRPVPSLHREHSTLAEAITAAGGPVVGDASALHVPGPQGSRLYRLPGADESELFVGVTSVSGRADDKQGLIAWAARCVAEAAVDEVATWSPMPPPAAINFLKRAHDRKRDDAADRGTDIHALLEQAAVGKMPDRIFLTEDQLASFDAGCAFLRNAVVEVLAIELPTVNYTTGTAGTIDLLARIELPGRAPFVAACDYKTGASVHAVTMGLQIAGGYGCAEYGVLPDGTLVSLPPIEAGLVIHIRPEKYPDGGYGLYLFDVTPELCDAFAHLAAFTRWVLLSEADIMRKLPPAPDTDYARRLAEVKAWIELLSAETNGLAALLELTANWPALVPMPKDAEGYTFDQYETIDAVFDAVCDRHQTGWLVPSEVRARVDAAMGIEAPADGPAEELVPAEPSAPPELAPADDRAEFVARCRALPTDVALDLTAAVRELGFEGHLAYLPATWVEPVEAILAEHERRALVTATQVATRLRTFSGDAMRAVAACARCTPPVTRLMAAHVDLVADAVDDGLLVIGDDGGLVAAPDALDRLVARAGGKAKLLAHARPICDSLNMARPKDSGAVVADARVAALVFASTNPNT